MSVDDGLQVLDARKHPALVVHQEDPLNAGTPPELARQSFLTPQAHFFVRNHGSVPHVSEYRYSLSVTGMVQSPLKLTLSELREEFHASTVMATLQCAGHRRRELATIQPIPGEIPWGAEAIGNALWTGVPLREVLLAVGIQGEAKHVAFCGLDEISRSGEHFGFGGSIPLEKALEPEVLLAYEMNGKPLPPLHGFPLRVVVPCYIGARSVKWLANIHVQEQPSTNYFQRKAYKLFPPDVQSEAADWEKATMQEMSDVSKGKLDIIVLRYMARRLHLTLHQLDQPDSLRRTRSQVYKLQERGGRTHRIAIYQPEKLLAQVPLSFVGFISARQKLLRPSIIQAIQRADKRLVEELEGAPGVLSYSSLELRNGDWCNLVLLSDAGAKTHIKGSEMHKYAAYHLAHSYYEWIRLHNGVMPEGLDHMEMQLQKTKYYTFQAGQQRPSIREFIYELSCRAQAIAVSSMVPAGTNAF